MTTIQKTLNVAIQDFCIELKDASKQTRNNAFKDGKEVQFNCIYQIDNKGSVKPETLQIEGLEIPSGFRIVYMNTTKIQNSYPECYNKFTHERLTHVSIRQSFDALFVCLVHKEQFIFNAKDNLRYFDSQMVKI